MDKIYWLAGFDAGGAIYKIENGKMEYIQDYDPRCKKGFAPKSIADLYVCPLCGCWMDRYE